MLLDWKGVKYADVKEKIIAGASDDTIAEFLHTNGTPKTVEEISEWSDGMDKLNPYFAPDKKEWYSGEVTKLGLDPATTPMFDWLDADDKATH